MNTVEVFSPAKLNLLLAILGRREDGFHELLSVATPLQWGDRLVAEPGDTDDLTLFCDDPEVPVDDGNLVLRAARAFRAATGWTAGVRFALEKHIPMGAGLGGGSSNAVAALRALNELAGGPLDDLALTGLAAGIGSDCALFVPGRPVAMRGRGERLAVLPDGPAGRLRGRRVLVFKPGFPIATGWAYGRLAATGKYWAADRAEAWLDTWLAGDAPAEELLANTLEAVAFAKYPALPVLLDRLRGDFGLAPRMSGSGSACFTLLPESGGPSVPELHAAIAEAWGPRARVIETRLA